MHTSLTARLQIMLNDAAFVAEQDYDNLEDLRAKLEAMAQHLGSGAVITLEAALIYIEPTDGHLDEDSQVVLGRLLESVGLDAESFFSEAAGSYDRFTNRVTAADMGLVFPDGTIRVVWTSVRSTQSLQASFDTVVKAVGLLVQAQDLPYTADDDEDESDILQNERTDILRANGMVLQG